MRLAIKRQQQCKNRNKARGNSKHFFILHLHVLTYLLLKSGLLTLPYLHYRQALQQMASTPLLRVPPPPTEIEESMGLISDNVAFKAGKGERLVLLSFDDMPEWFRRESNKWILHGYRPISGSVHASFCSWSYIHNESVNIYSHLIPAVFFLLGEWYINQYLASRYSGVTSADFIAFSIFMLTAATCLSLSATYHTLINHSQNVEHLCLRLDMLGVVIFIMGDLVLGIYMVFWCEPLPRNIYWSLVS
jgi:adiponectin receptor